MNNTIEFALGRSAGEAAEAAYIKGELPELSKLIRREAEAFHAELVRAAALVGEALGAGDVDALCEVAHSGLIRTDRYGGRADHRFLRDVSTLYQAVTEYEDLTNRLTILD